MMRHFLLESRKRDLNLSLSMIQARRFINDLMLPFGKCRQMLAHLDMHEINVLIYGHYFFPLYLSTLICQFTLITSPVSPSVFINIIRQLICRKGSSDFSRPFTFRAQKALSSFSEPLHRSAAWHA